MNYIYTYQNNVTGKTHEGYITNMPLRKNVIKAIQYRLLNTKRDNRIAELFFNFDGDINDPIAVQQYLPEQYKKYSNDIPLLRRKLLPFNHIVINYKITLTQGPQCLGCLYNESGQHYHMIEPHGCQV